MCREDGLRKGLAPFRQACGSGGGLLGSGSDLREKPDPDPTALLPNRIQIQHEKYLNTVLSISDAKYCKEGSILDGANKSQ